MSWHDTIITLLCLQASVITTTTGVAATSSAQAAAKI
jgi:hypothetical protein